MRALWSLCVFGVVLSFELRVGLRQRNLDKLEQQFWSVADPQSKQYLKHMSLPAIKSLIGASAEDVEAASAWLSSLGAKTIKLNSLGDTLTAEFESMKKGVWTEKGFPHPSARPVRLDYVLRRDPKIATESFAKEPRRPRNTLGSDIPNQKKSYELPLDWQATNSNTSQMVWGPGTYGYSPAELEVWKVTAAPLLNTEKVVFDTENHGQPGGDNFGEGTLDVHMIAAMTLNASTLVSNTNTSASTEEGNGFGQAFLDFVTDLSARTTNVPQVLSLSLGSLSAYSCDLLCAKAVEKGFSLDECNAFMQKQRQVCMYLTQDQVQRISNGLMVLGVRGISVFGSSGDGGSHFSFEPFSGGALANALNDISCAYQLPVFPTSSPYIISVGGTAWKNMDITKPIAWNGSGGGLSWEFSMPSHQVAVVSKYLSSTPGLPPSSSFNASGRAYPDLSAIAYDGTSESCPTVAGLFSLLNDYRANKGLPALGFVATRIWQVAQSFPGEAFVDILEGNSQTSCNNGFPCAPGWDPVTGWGSPLWPGLLKHFSSDAHL